MLFYCLCMILLYHKNSHVLIWFLIYWLLWEEMAGRRFPFARNARFQRLCKVAGIWSSGAAKCTVYSSKHSKLLFYKLMCQICLYKYIFWFIMYIYVFFKCTIGNWSNHFAWRDTHTFRGSASLYWMLWGRQWLIETMSSLLFHHR
jgi:hypothetical protein